MQAGVAAGHPATAAAGIEILEDGGTRRRCRRRRLPRLLRRRDGDDRPPRRRARDPLGRAARRVNLDCFVTVPSRQGGCADRPRRPVRRGARPLRDRAGVLRACRASRPGSRRSGARCGRLPWRRLVEPALRLARAGVTMPPAHAACLAMLEPVITLTGGAARSTRRAGSCSRRGPARPAAGSSTRSRLLAAEGAASGVPGHARRARSLGASTALRSRGPTSTAYEAALGRARRGRVAPASASSPAAGCRACPRRSGACRALRGLARDRARAARSSTRSTAARGPTAHTTNLVTVDARGPRVRPDDEPRPRLGRLPARPRPAAEQHARRGRPPPRAARAPASGWRA